MSADSTPIDRNKNPILDSIRSHLVDGDVVLEIGSGSCEHIKYFSSSLPGVKWQPSDLSICYFNDQVYDNILTPMQLDMMDENWHVGLDVSLNAILTINTLHIMPWQGVKNFWLGCESIRNLEKVIIYGPFKIAGEFKTDSDIEFEKWLKSRSILSGLRDISDITQLAKKAGFRLEKNYDMPANNHLLVFIRN